MSKGKIEIGDNLTFLLSLIIFLFFICYVGTLKN